MKYIKNVPFTTLDAKDLALGTEKNQTNASMLQHTLESYQPSQELRLSLGELRQVNKMITVFKKGGSVIELEDADYDLLKRVAAVILPQFIGELTRLAPALDDVINSAVGTKPKDTK